MEKRSRNLLWLLFFATAAIVIGLIRSQSFSPDVEIFLTDSISFFPKTQPIFYALYVVVNLVIVLIAIRIGLWISEFLFKKGVAFHVVGSALLLGGIFLGLSPFLIQRADNEIAEYIVMGL